MPRHATTSKTMGRPRADAVRALDRGLAILIELSSGAERSLTDIAAALDLPYSTTHRLLETLAARGFVQQAGRFGRWAIGVRAFQVGTGYVRTGVTEAARAPMEELVEALGETVNLAVRDGADAVYVHQVEGRQKIRMFTRVGTRVPLHCSGVGKALLAWEPRAALEALAPSGSFESFTANTRTTPRDLGRDLDATVGTGVAIDLEEYVLGVRCAAAPIRDATGAVAAALSVSAPLPRLDDERLSGVGRRLVACAEDVSRRLGWLGS